MQSIRRLRVSLVALVAASALLAGAGAQAQTRYWSLQGFKFSDGAIATGRIAYDHTTLQVSNWNISVSDGTDPQFFEFTYMPGNSIATSNTNLSSIPTLYFASVGAGGQNPPKFRLLRITPKAVLDGTPTTVSIDFNVDEGNNECIACDPLRSLVDGDLVQVLLPPPPALVDVVEYYSTGFDHYFITASPTEINALDSGFPAGWTRTGQVFKAFAAGSGGGGPTASPVCRFYANSAATHFYSAIAVECRNVAVDLDDYWLQEAGNVFQMELPDTASGACPAGTVPVYRVFNNRADANHRYTTSTLVRAQMEAAGWTREGYGPNAVIMCARPPA